MHYVVYGAGAIGGVIGGRLAQHGRDVTLVARGRHLQAIQAGGLEMRDPDGSVRVQVPAVGHPAQARLRPGDVVVLAVKSQDTVVALDELNRLGVPRLVVCCAQNGVQNERSAARRFADVVGMCVMLPALHLEPGVVELSWAPVGGLLDLGRYPSGTHSVAEAITADLQASGFRSRARSEVMRAKYGKLLTNLGNVLDAACGPAASDPVPIEIEERARAEGVACLRAAGITWDDEGDMLAGVPRMRPVDGRMRPGGSTWQSLARGHASLEADYLNGEIVLLGRLHGVSTPVNEALQRLAWRLARERLAPGGVAVTELLTA